MKVAGLIFASVLFQLVGCSASNEPVKAGPAPELRGVPSWLALGGDVPDSGSRMGAQTKGQYFVMESRWFEGAEAIPAPPRTIATDRDGLRISLTPAVVDEKIVVLNASVTSTNRPVFRMTHETRSNVWPVLFATYVDGAAVKALPGTLPPTTSRLERIRLLEAGETRAWLLRIRKEALKSLLPDEKPHEIALIVAFCEMPHIPVDEATITATGKAPVVRSEQVRLRWTGKDWVFLQ